MKFTTAFIVALGLALAVEAADWVALSRTMHRRVPRLEMTLGNQQGVCSSVVFEVKDKTAYALTAAHCVEGPEGVPVEVAANRKPATVLRHDANLDLAIISFPATNEMPVAIASFNPPMGSEVAVFGYGFGIRDLAMQVGNIAQSFNRDMETTLVAVDMLFGDSGGPTVDANGKLVGINSEIIARGPAHLALIVPVSKIRSYLKSFRAEASV